MTNNIAMLLTNQINNQSKIPSTDVIQLTLTLKMTTTQVVETSVTVNNNSPIQDYVHLDDQTQPTFEFLILDNFTFWYYHFSTLNWLGLNTYWILLTAVSNCILEFCPSWISQSRNNRVWRFTICQAFLITAKLKKHGKWKKEFQKC